MRSSEKQGLASVSPWVLAAACGLLTIIITVFAVNNYRREKALMTDVLLERGATLIRFVTSGARASLMTALRENRISGHRLADHVHSILEHGSEHPGVHHITLMDTAGRILVSSDEESIGKVLDEETLLFIKTLELGKDEPGKFHYRMNDKDKTPSFQVAAFFRPIDRRRFVQRFPNHPMMMRGLPEIDQVLQLQYFILVELDLAQFNKAVKRQRLQIVVLSVVLLLVGIGGWLSILTLERLKGSQSRLSQVRAFRDSLITFLPVGLVATDNSGKIRLFNQFTEQICSVSEAEVLGQLPPKVLPRVISEPLSTRGQKDDGDNVYLKEVELFDGRGKPLILQLTALSVVDSKGDFAGRLLLIQDLSQVKRLQAEVRRNERMAALGKMAAGVAHELRNPLSSIKGLAVLLGSRFKKESSDYQTAHILTEEVDRLNRSISELLDYSRPHELQKKSCDLGEVISEALTLIRVDAEAAGVEIGAEFDAGYPEVAVDQDKIKQVFLNLFLNSIQAMESGGELRVVLDERAGRLRCRVSDTGCGLDAVSLAKVFDPYFTTKPQGTGLGLAMSAKIVEEHGGTITMASDPGKGTTVTVILS
ncbi:MAG: ATP-binding protein [Thermodesulfobacteriota bacterium]